MLENKYATPCNINSNMTHNYTFFSALCEVRFILFLRGFAALPWMRTFDTMDIHRIAKLHINSLTTVGYLLVVFIKLWIPSMVRIFTSAWS